MRKPVTISLSEDTEDVLNFLCERLGLKKSQAISFALNTIALEKYDYVKGKGESDGK